MKKFKNAECDKSLTQTNEDHRKVADMGTGW